MTTVPVPEGSVMEGVSSLEVRWILPGHLDAAVTSWFSRCPLEMESREDAYLLSPDLGGLSVKVRAAGTLEVKVFRGSPGTLDVPGHVHGRLQSWQKWSFPFSPPGPGRGHPAGWRRVRKQRRTSRFSLTSRRVTAWTREQAGEAQCAVELTEVRTQHRDWWSLGLEATGAADLLRAGLEATAELVFGQGLPVGVELGMKDSMSYAEWLPSLPDSAAR